MFELAASLPAFKSLVHSCREPTVEPRVLQKRASHERFALDLHGEDLGFAAKAKVEHAKLLFRTALYAEQVGCTPEGSEQRRQRHQGARLLREAANRGNDQAEHMLDAMSLDPWWVDILGGSAWEEPEPETGWRHSEHYDIHFIRMHFVDFGTPGATPQDARKPVDVDAVQPPNHRAVVKSGSPMVVGSPGVFFVEIAEGFDTCEHACFGLGRPGMCTDTEAAFRTSEFWAVMSPSLHLVHNSRVLRWLAEMPKNNDRHLRLGLRMDCQHGILTVYRNGERLGVAAAGLTGQFCWAASLEKQAQRLMAITTRGAPPEMTDAERANEAQEVHELLTRPAYIDSESDETVAYVARFDARSDPET